MSKRYYYFVDYENVHEAGLEGMNQLPRESEVHLFYSQNANKLNLDLLRFVKAKLEVHRVKPGKQSLDMQMVSYLGYCIGEAGREGVFVLVSKDTDYANTVLFWREEGVEVRVQPAIREEKNADGMERALRAVKVTRRGRRGGKKNAAQESAAETAAQAAGEPVKAEVAEPAAKSALTAPAAPAEAPAENAKPAVPQSEEAPKEEKKTRRGRRGGRGRKSQTENAAEAEVKTEASAEPAAAAKPEEKAPAQPEKPARNAQPEKAEKPAAKAPAEKPKTAAPETKPVQNTVLPSEPAKVTVTVHDVPMVTHAVPEAKPERSQTAARAQAALAEKKADAAVARKVASIIQKHEGQKNSRQAIYLEIRKTFGQKMGVDLYNSVKGLLK